MDWNKFYDNIEAVRKSKGIKVGFMEDYIGVCRGYFSRRVKMNLDIAYRVAKFFDVDIETLIEKNIYAENRMKYLSENIDRMNHELMELERSIDDDDF